MYRFRVLEYCSTIIALGYPRVYNNVKQAFILLLFSAVRNFSLRSTIVNFLDRTFLPERAKAQRAHLIVTIGLGQATLNGVILPTFS